MHSLFRREDLSTMSKIIDRKVACANILGFDGIVLGLVEVVGQGLCRHSMSLLVQF